MDLVIKGKGKKGLIIKTWERCRSLGGGIGRKTRGGRKPATGQEKLKHSKSWPRTATDHQLGEEEEADKRRGRGGGSKIYRRVAPEGCFSVYVGPKKQRFVIRTQCLNHPLFKILLEEAESEYGYSSEGPIELPCEVDSFIKVLIEMDDSDDIFPPRRCSFGGGGRSYSSYHLLPASPKIAFLQ